jgi:phospholipase/carboxylesterase
MALRIAMRDPQRFAAVASFGGRMPNGCNAFGDLKRLRERRLSMLWQWAEDDECYQPDTLRQDIQSALTIHAKVDILQYKGDDEMNTAALAELNQWIMSRVVSGVTTDSATDRWATSPTEFSCN